MLREFPIHGCRQDIPGTPDPVPGAVRFSAINGKEAIAESTRHMDIISKQGIFQAHLDFVRSLVFHPSKTRQLSEIGIGPPTLHTLILRIDVVIELSYLSSERIERIVHPKASTRLPGCQFNRFGSTSFLQEIIDHTTKLRTILKGGGSPHHFYPLNGFQGREIV